MKINIEKLAASPLEIWDVMPPYLKGLLEQKTENL